MTYAQMISLLPDADSSVEVVGREFFSGCAAAEDKKKLLEFLLDDKRYGQLFRLIYCACINGNFDTKNIGADYVAVTGGKSTINTRYFSLFVQTAMDCGINESKFVPMLFLAATADKNDILYAWQTSSMRYLTGLARADYDKAWEYLRKNDAEFKLVSILLAVDRDRALRDLAELAVFGKGVNKVALRKFLRDHKDEVFDYVRPIYSTLKNDNRVAAVRLLLLYKNADDVQSFLREIAETESSQSVRKLLGGRAVRNLSIGDNPDRRQVIKFFYDAMLFGTSFTSERFLREIIMPPFAEIADSLFFGVYRDGRLDNIIIVDEERVLDIENTPCIPPDDCEIRVLHPVELTNKTEFLKRLNIVQPFDQIKRKIYAPSDDDKRNNACFGISGTVAKAWDFKASMRKLGFRALGGGASCEQVGIARSGILCVLNISRVDLADVSSNGTVHAQSVRFYAEKDVVRLGGKQFVESVAPLSPARIEPRVFSEFMHSVYELMGCQ